MRKTVALLLLVLSAGWGLAQSPRKAVEARNGMVVCVSPPATEVGVEILKKGGNAVDASVAVALAMAVTWPEAGNIGGGGFFHVWPGQGKPSTVIDYREMAPAASTATMFIDKKADDLTHLAAGVPGTVRGLEMAHKKWGSLPWRELVEPSVQLAQNGFRMTASLANRLNNVLSDKKTTNAEFIRCYGKNGTLKDKWQAGDTLKLPDLAKTLAAIRDQGSDGFYKGDVAKLIAKEMASGNGIMTEADLAAYQAIERPSITTRYRGHDVSTTPLPSGGGVVLLESLNILGTFDLKKHDRFSAETIHLMSESMRRAFADRAKYLGDPAFSPFPEFLLSAEHAKKRASTIDPAKASRSESLPDSVPLQDRPEGTSTTHFSVIDHNGMAVSNTYTLENSFGNRIVVRGAGFLSQQRNDRFNIRPGLTNRTGSVGTKPNVIEPSKRMLSSMCPTFVAKDGKLLLITGSPGGRTIPNTVLNVVVNVVDYGMDAQAAVDAPRHHQQWFPDRITLERTKDRADVVDRLRAMGHTVINSRQGDAQTIRIDPVSGVYQGAADSRIDGKAKGY
ncbi:MAG: gamma-glutamyltransferase [Gemmataceae bacterium]